MLHCHYLKDSLHANFSRKALTYIGDFGMFGFVSGFALTGFYGFMEIYYRTGELVNLQNSSTLVAKSVLHEFNILATYLQRDSV